MTESDLYATWKRGCIVEHLATVKDTYLPHFDPSSSQPLKSLILFKDFNAHKMCYNETHNLIGFASRIDYIVPLLGLTGAGVSSSKPAVILLNITTGDLTFLQDHHNSIYSEYEYDYNTYYTTYGLSALTQKTSVWNVDDYTYYIPLKPENAYLSTPKGSYIFGLTNVYLEKNIAVGCTEKQTGFFAIERLWYIFRTEKKINNYDSKLNLVLTPLVAIQELSSEKIQNIAFTPDGTTVIIFLYNGKILKIKQLSSVKPSPTKKLKDTFFRYQ